MGDYRTLVVLQPTSFCNIDCRYCYLPDRKNVARMGMEVVERIAAEVFASEFVEAPVVFLWHLGEPLSVPRSFYEEAFAAIEQASRGHGKPYLLSFQTNGTLLDEAWVDLIQRHRIRLGVSIDGPAFLHDRQRVTRAGAGTHALVMRAVKLLQAAEAPFSVISVLTDFTLDYADEYFDFFLENEIHDIGFNIDEIEGVHADSTFRHDLGVKRYRRFLSRLLTLTESHGGRIKFREAWTNLRTLALGTESPYNTTNQAYRILNFDVAGNYSTFCPELIAARSPEYGNFAMGNILSERLADLPRNALFQRVQREIEAGVGKCRETCRYWRFCGGGSPSNKFFEQGRFDITETMTCRIHKKATVDVLLEHLEGRLRKSQASGALAGR